MMFWQSRQTSASGGFAKAESLSCATHVKNLSWHNGQWPREIPCWPPNMALLAAENDCLQYSVFLKYHPF